MTKRGRQVPSRAQFLAGLANQKDSQSSDSNDTGMVIVAYLIAGIGFYGGLGWAIDHYVLHSHWLAPIGILLGMAMSVFLIIKKFGANAS